MAAKFQDGDKVKHRIRGIGIFRGLDWTDDTCYVDFGEGEERVTLSLIEKAEEDASA